MANFGCCDPCKNCGTDENGNVTEDRCPNCGERSAGEKVCMSCENDAAWERDVAENGHEVTCETCKTVFRTIGDSVIFCSVECAVGGDAI